MRRAEHEQRAEAFRQRLAAEADKPPGQQEWPDLSDWVTIEVTATCRTAGCSMQDTGVAVVLHENGDGVYRAVCGRCGQPHTDLVADFDDGPANLAPQAQTLRMPRPAGHAVPSQDAPMGVES